MDSQTFQLWSTPSSLESFVLIVRNSNNFQWSTFMSAHKLLLLLLDVRVPGDDDEYTEEKQQVCDMRRLRYVSQIQ